MSLAAGWSPAMGVNAAAALSLGAPLGLLALTGLAPLLAAYFLRRRQQPLRVSALFLWRSPDVRAQAGPRWQRFSRELSLLLESLAVLCLALFLADPQCGPSARERHLVLVMDSSLSMAAHVSASETVAERARQQAAHEVERVGATAVTVVLSGKTPRVLAGPRERATAALHTLEGWTPGGPTTSLDPAVSFARELAGTTGVVAVITDGAAPGELPANVSWFAVGAPLDNVAVVAAQRREVGPTSRLTVRVQSFARAPRQVALSLRAEPLPGVATAGHNAEERREQFLLAPGEVRAVSWEAANAGTLHVELPADALPEDGVVVLPRAPEKTVRVQLSAALDDTARAALRRGLLALEAVTVVDAGGELTIGPEPTARIVVAAAAPERSFVGPFFAEHEDPLLEDVALGGVVWTAGASPPGVPLLSAGDVRLLTVTPDGRVVLNVDLSRSNLIRTPAWPVLLANLVRHAREQLPGFTRSTWMLGQDVGVVVEGVHAAGAHVTILGPDGSAQPVLSTGLLLLPPFERAGTYQLLRDGRVTDTSQVLPLAPAESDLRDRTSAVRTRTQGAGEGGPPLAARRSPWPLALVLALVALDFAVTGRSG